MKNILVCVDFSNVTPALIDAAKQIACAFKANVVLLNVSALPETHVQAGTHLVRSATTDYHVLNELKKTLEDSGLKGSAEQLEGWPVEIILKKAEDMKADLIIMGSHGHGVVYNLLVGSVTDGVLKSVKCPVLIVPSPRIR